MREGVDAAVRAARRRQRADLVLLVHGGGKGGMGRKGEGVSGTLIEGEE